MWLVTLYLVYFIQCYQSINFFVDLTHYLGHCRRRKIRCIPAAGDAQNRCSNCIRLKKECHFHPVDQQAESGSGRRDSQVQGGIGQASSSPSPTNGAGLAPELHNTLPYPPHLSMPPIHHPGSSQIKRPRTDSFSPDTKGKFSNLRMLKSP